MVWVNLRENPSHVDLQQIAVPDEASHEGDANQQKKSGEDLAESDVTDILGTLLKALQDV